MSPRKHPWKEPHKSRHSLSAPPKVAPRCVSACAYFLHLGKERTRLFKLKNTERQLQKNQSKGGAPVTAGIWCAELWGPWDLAASCRACRWKAWTVWQDYEQGEAQCKSSIFFQIFNTWRKGGRNGIFKWENVMVITSSELTLRNQSALLLYRF